MANSSQYGAYVPTNFLWDVQQLQQIEVTSPEFKELLIRLYQNLNLMALVINVKDTGMYPIMEMVNGQLWFPNPANNSSTAAAPAERQVLRKVINFGALGAGVTPLNHNIAINAAYTFTRIYGVASSTTTNDYYPLPFASAGGANNIELRVTATQVIITNNSGIAFNFCYIILEYITS